MSLVSRRKLETKILPGGTSEGNTYPKVRKFVHGEGSNRRDVLSVPCSTDPGRESLKFRSSTASSPSPVSSPFSFGLYRGWGLRTQSLGGRRETSPTSPLPSLRTTSGRSRFSPYQILPTLLLRPWSPGTSDRRPTPTLRQVRS